MSESFVVHRPEQAYQRTVQFVVELIDPVTLERISRGVKVVAEGLRGKPVVNASGMFVWLKGEMDSLREIRIDPGTLPYETITIRKDKLKIPPSLPPLTTIELPLRTDYAFSVGTTGIRGTLVEERINQPTPIPHAEVSLEWLDDDGTTWHDARMHSTTNDKGGFVSVLRLAPADMPSFDTDGAISVRLRARREGAGERRSAEVQIPLGRVSDPSYFSWDEFQP